jgi:Ca2+-binding RTX toxin-like protein
MANLAKNTLNGCTTATGTMTNNAQKNFSQMLDALGEFESGKLAGDKLQYAAINWLHFVGKYQFGEAILKDLGYYDSTRTDTNNLVGNPPVPMDWSNQVWSGKDGVTKLGLTSFPSISTGSAYYPNQTFDSASLLGNVIAQESAIRQAFAQYLHYLIYASGGFGSIQALTTKLNQNNVTMSGILAGSHLVGWSKAIQYLNNPTTIPTDENGTEITKYIQDYGGYQTPFGTSDSESLIGTKYNDVLIGFGGNDKLTGGAGADRFRFYSASEGIDKITDFNPATEKIELYQAGFGGNSLYWQWNNTDPTKQFDKLLSPGVFQLGSSASNSDHRIIYNSSTGDIFFDPDGTGSQAQVKFAQLTAGLNLNNTNFTVF